MMSGLVAILKGYGIPEKIKGAKMRAFWERLLSFSFRYRWPIAIILVLYWLLDNVYAGTGNPIFDLFHDFSFPDGEITLLLAIALLIASMRSDLLERINETEREINARINEMTKDMGEFKNDIVKSMGEFKESFQREMREHIKHFHSKS
jgi:hypothetical protein